MCGVRSVENAECRKCVENFNFPLQFPILVMSMIIQGVDRSNTTAIGQDRKYKDLQSISLTSTSLNIPFLYEIKGVFLKTSLSKGWFCIRCHLFIGIC